MATHETAPNDTKATFRQCGTCSETFGSVLDREFGHQAPEHERALGLLAGGIVARGRQCGMLWGATMAVGAEASRRCLDPNEGVGLALAATRYVVESFEARAETVECRDITGRKLNTWAGKLGMLFDVLRAGGLDDYRCFELAEDWTPEAIAAAREGLSKAYPHDLPARSCASEVVRAMGGTPEEVVMAAGFGGGMGLSGHGCGALAAAVWMQGLQWVRAHPGEEMDLDTVTGENALLRAFEDRTDGEYECRRICGRRFESVDEHSRFVAEGGCRELIEVLSGT